MPELRENLATKRWVIIATERAKRSEEFVNKTKAIAHPAYDPKCPFCEGNEAANTGEVLAYRKPGSEVDGKGWHLRVVPNKYPALIEPTGPPSEVERSKSGIYLRMDGVGKHEVVVESPIHNKTIATMSIDEVERVITAYRDRYLALDWDPHYKLIIVFRNQGGLAGASQVHPHSQIVAAAVIPYHIRSAIYEAQRYYDELGKCVFCDMIKNETREQERIVLQNEKFIAFVPYAAMVPYETWIFPLQHETTFADLQPSEVRPLAQILRDVLAKFYHSLGNPAYNYCVRSVPHYSAGEPYYHWYIQILPRITTIAGFEIGSGININISLPEESAKFLREFKVNPVRELRSLTVRADGGIKPPSAL